MTGVFGEGRRFQAEIPERVGDSRIVVDGVDLTKAVHGFHVHGWDGDPGSAVTVTLNLPMVEATTIDTHHATVVLGAECTQLLIDAGWVPPEAAAELLAVVDTARAWQRGEVRAVDVAEALDTYQGGPTDG